jgi:hypothetical protein
MEKSTGSRQTAILFRAFLKSTIIGHESGLYKTNAEHDVIPFILADLTAEYFNMCYDGLANKTDPYVVQKMNEMQAPYNHSPICLMNLLFRSCLQIHMSLDRSHFVYGQGYEAFMKSVENEFAKLCPSIENITALLDHECKGDKEVKPIPAGKKMFSVTQTFVTERK